MLIRFDIVLKDLDGTDLVDGTVPVTLALASRNALLAVLPDELNLSGDEKFKRYQLAKKVSGAAGHIEISVEEATLIKKLIGRAYGANVVGPAYLAIDPPAP